MLHFPVDLRQSFLTAHCENGVAESDKDSDQRDCMRQAAEAQPAQGFRRKRQIGTRRQRRQMSAAHPDGYDAPGNHHDHHHGSHIHDPQRFSTGFGNSLDILPPEINRHGQGKLSRGGIDWKRKVDVQTAKQLVQESRQVLARGDAADGPGQNVIEHQRGDGKFRQRAAHGLLDHAIDATANEHAATFDIHGSHGIREQHDGQDEPGRGFSNGLLGDGACVERGRAKIVEYNGGRPPKGDERQHGGRGNYDLRKTRLLCHGRVL